MQPSVHVPLLLENWMHLPYEQRRPSGVHVLHLPAPKFGLALTFIADFVGLCDRICVGLGCVHGRLYQFILLWCQICNKRSCLEFPNLKDVLQAQFRNDLHKSRQLFIVQVSLLLRRSAERRATCAGGTPRAHAFHECTNTNTVQTRVQELCKQTKLKRDDDV